MLRAHYGGATNAGTDEPSGSSSSRASLAGGSSQPRIDRDPASTRSNRSARAAAGSSRVAQDSRTQFAEDSSRRDRGSRVAKSNVASLGGGGGGAGMSGVEGGSIDLGESVKAWIGGGSPYHFFFACHSSRLSWSCFITNAKRMLHPLLSPSHWPPPFVLNLPTPSPDSPDFSPEAYHRHILSTASLSGLVKASNVLTVGEFPPLVAKSGLTLHPPALLRSSPHATPHARPQIPPRIPPHARLQPPLATLLGVAHTPRAQRTRARDPSRRGGLAGKV